VLDPINSPLHHAELLYDIKGARAYHRGEVPGPEAVGVRAQDEVTLVVELESAVAYFLQLLAYPGTLPVPRHLVRQCGEAWADPENLVTNGPFQLHSWKRGQPVVLARNPQYHGWFTGNVQRVELFGGAGLSDRELVDRYEADDLDHLGIGELSEPEFLRALEHNANDFVLAPWAALFYYGFDVTRPPFDDARVRRAFALATDPRALDRPATGGFVPDRIPAHTPGLRLPFDPAGARQLLAEAGYPGGLGLPEIESLLYPGGFGEPYRDLQDSQWADGLGIKIRWVVLPWRDWPARFREEPPHVYTDCLPAYYSDPDWFLRMGFPWDRTRWSDETYTRLLEEARHSTDQDKRIELYRQADGILMEEAVVVPVEYGGQYWLVKPWLAKFRPAIAQRIMFWREVILEPH
jgi:oligopeptide transport system substrate-binding protein